MQKFPLDYVSKEEDPDLWDQVVLQEKEAFDFGFYWETFCQLLQQIQSEVDEVKEAFEVQNQEHLQEEIGDLIHASLGLAIFCGCNPKETLSLSIQKFHKRFVCLKKTVLQEGHLDLKGKPLNILMDYWERSKEETKD